MATWINHFSRSKSRSPSARGMFTPRNTTSVIFSKGLLNAPGDNNCFLNSAVQVLWHLDVFRRSFREMTGHACMGKACIFCALKTLLNQLQTSDETVLPPDALRKALASAFKDQLRFQLGCMDDAAECFENILVRIHFHLAHNIKEDLCDAKHCIPHRKFAMTIIEHSVCKCGATSEPFPFTQMVHYVSSTALCSEAHKMRAERWWPNTDHFGVLLRKAGAVGDVRDCPSACGQKISIRRVLMNCPDVVSIGLIWDSDKPDVEHISDVICNLGTALQLRELFDDTVDDRAKANSLFLVGIVTYYGRHYTTFFYNTSLRYWIYFDDAVVKQVGHNWSDVVDRCRRGHFQPLLLLYAYPDGKKVPNATAPRHTFLMKGYEKDDKENEAPDHLNKLSDSLSSKVSEILTAPEDQVPPINHQHGNSMSSNASGQSVSSGDSQNTLVYRPVGGVPEFQAASEESGQSPPRATEEKKKGASCVPKSVVEIGHDALNFVPPGKTNGGSYAVSQYALQGNNESNGGRVARNKTEPLNSQGRTNDKTSEPQVSSAVPNSMSQTAPLQSQTGRPSSARDGGRGTKVPMSPKQVKRPSSTPPVTRSQSLKYSSTLTPSSAQSHVDGPSQSQARRMRESSKAPSQNGAVYNARTGVITGHDGRQTDDKNSCTQPSLSFEPFGNFSTEVEMSPEVQKNRKMDIKPLQDLSYKQQPQDMQGRGQPDPTNSRAQPDPTNSRAQPDPYTRAQPDPTNSRAQPDPYTRARPDPYSTGQPDLNSRGQQPTQPTGRASVVRQGSWSGGSSGQYTGETSSTSWKTPAVQRSGSLNVKPLDRFQEEHNTDSNLNNAKSQAFKSSSSVDSIVNTGQYSKYSSVPDLQKQMSDSYYGGNSSQTETKQNGSSLKRSSSLQSDSQIAPGGILAEAIRNQTQATPQNQEEKNYKPLLRASSITSKNSEDKQARAKYNIQNGFLTLPGKKQANQFMSGSKQSLNSVDVGKMNGGSSSGIGYSSASMPQRSAPHLTRQSSIESRTSTASHQPHEGLSMRQTPEVLVSPGLDIDSIASRDSGYRSRDRSSASSGSVYSLDAPDNAPASSSATSGTNNNRVSTTYKQPYGNVPQVSGGSSSSQSARGDQTSITEHGQRPKTPSQLPYQRSLPEDVQRSQTPQLPYQKSLPDDVQRPKTPSQLSYQRSLPEEVPKSAVQGPEDMVHGLVQEVEFQLLSSQKAEMDGDLATSLGLCTAAASTLKIALRIDNIKEETRHFLQSKYNTTVRRSRGLHRKLTLQRRSEEPVIASSKTSPPPPPETADAPRMPGMQKRLSKEDLLRQRHDQESAQEIELLKRRIEELSVQRKNGDIGPDGQAQSSAAAPSGTAARVDTAGAPSSRSGYEPQQYRSAPASPAMRRSRGITNPGVTTTSGNGYSSLTNPKTDQGEPFVQSRTQQGYTSANASVPKGSQPTQSQSRVYQGYTDSNSCPTTMSQAPSGTQQGYTTASSSVPQTPQTQSQKSIYKGYTDSSNGSNTASQIQSRTEQGYTAASTSVTQRAPFTQSQSHINHGYTDSSSSTASGSHTPYQAASQVNVQASQPTTQGRVQASSSVYQGYTMSRNSATTSQSVPNQMEPQMNSRAAQPTPQGTTDEASSYQKPSVEQLRREFLKGTSQTSGGYAASIGTSGRSATPLGFSTNTSQHAGTINPPYQGGYRSQTPTAYLGSSTSKQYNRSAVGYQSSQPEATTGNRNNNATVQQAPFGSSRGTLGGDRQYGGSASAVTQGTNSYNWAQRRDPPRQENVALERVIMSDTTAFSKCNSALPQPGCVTGMNGAGLQPGVNGTSSLPYPWNKRDLGDNLIDL